MKQFPFLTILFVFLSLFAKSQQKNIISSDFNPIVSERPADYEYLSAPDSLGKRSPLKMPSEESKGATGIQIPYPIIFIHGINSCSSTWDIFTNYLDDHFAAIYGGRFDFCLNYDGNNYTTNKDIYAPLIPSADIALFSGTWNNGDYYYINFDVGFDGSFHPNGGAYDVLSNQSAIAKQGAALAWAIQLVLEKTGRNKVILMGHSMGGLAARDYLQNWFQSDGQHHVAKLATTGTPHGGSNEVTGGMTLSGVDCQSEAYRDLRTSFSGSGNNGIYLFGGLESNSVMNLAFCSNFYNIDVNCNGILGENITGLNYKTIPLDLSYSCVIGTGSNLGGDGCVGAIQADINNYIPDCNADTFILEEPLILTTAWHVELPKQIVGNIKLLDEPNEYNLSYNVGFDTTYNGFTTIQHGGGYMYDYDDYSFSLPVNSNVNVKVNSIYLSDLMVHIVDSNENIVGTTIHSNGVLSINFTKNLSAGKYYLEIYGTPTDVSYLYPYNFILAETPVVTDVALSEMLKNILIYPNPATSFLNVTGITSKITIRLFDVLGKLVMETEADGNITLDTSQLTERIYTLVAESKNDRTFKKVIITR